MAVVVLIEKGIAHEFVARETTVNSGHYVETLSNLSILSQKANV